MFGDIYLVFIFTAFLASFSFYFLKPNPVYLLIFPPYLGITLSVEILGTWMAYSGKNTILLYTVFTTVEIVFYIWMFREMVHSANTKKVLNLALYIYPLLVLLNKLFVQKGDQFHTITFGLGSLLVVACAVYYFFELFSADKSVNLIRQPEFWISSGLLFFYSCSFPLFSLINYFYSPSAKIVQYIASLLSLVNILLYSSFIVAFLCRIRIRK